METDEGVKEFAEAVKYAALITGLTSAQVASSIQALASAGEPQQNLEAELEELTQGGK